MDVEARGQLELSSFWDSPLLSFESGSLSLARGAFTDQLVGWASESRDPPSSAPHPQLRESVCVC